MSGSEKKKEESLEIPGYHNKDYLRVEMNLLWKTCHL